ncbi:MAG: 50S ribosomal protein L35 [Clostridiales bacterium]|jgi:large subunit ribosomal protein L35|nr:50S ribosomal protein L35 [Clostridiales bacterium]
MPKMKCHSGAKKRFHLNGAGKVKRAKQGKNHILTKKDRKTKRNLRHGGYVDESQAKTISNMIGKN